MTDQTFEIPRQVPLLLWCLTWGDDGEEEDEDCYMGALTASGVWVDERMCLMEPENQTKVLFWCPVTEPKRKKD